MFDFDSLFEERVDKKLLIIIAIAIVLAFYVYDLIFGKKSFLKMIELHQTKKELKKRVDKLKKENEILQKQYFELKELEG